MTNSAGGVSRQSPLQHSNSNKGIASKDVLNALEVVKVVIKREEDREKRKKKRKASWHSFLEDAEEAATESDA